MAEVAKERTGWRDEGISRHHRLWGLTCQATDIDFVLLEYHNEYGVVKPSALIEYKNEYAKHQNYLTLQYKALESLATGSNLPFFVTRYSRDFKNYFVVPMNAWAKTKLKEPRDMTEIQYVRFLYWLRGLNTVPQDVLNKISAPEYEESLFGRI